MKRSILPIALELSQKKLYNKAIFAYRIFQINNPEIADILDFNIDFFEKKISQNKYLTSNCNELLFNVFVENKDSDIQDYFIKFILPVKDDIKVEVVSDDRGYILRMTALFQKSSSNDFLGKAKKFLVENKFFDEKFYREKYKTQGEEDIIQYYINSGSKEGDYCSVWSGGRFSKNNPEEVYLEVKGDLIVSLTSYGGRVKSVHQVIKSLLNQTVKGYKVILWLSKDEFKNKEKDLPKDLVNLIGERFEVMWTKDIRSYTKLVPALNKFPRSIIVTADDDIKYQDNWLELLYREHLKYPRNIIAHRAHRIKEKDKNILPYNMWAMRTEMYGAYYRNFLTGVGGVLYPVGAMHSDVIREDLFTKLSPFADDVWFWAMCLMNNRKIHVPRNCQKKLTYIDGTQIATDDNTPLHHQNVHNGGNDEQVRNVLKAYPKVRELLLSERRAKPVEIVFICDQNYANLTSVAICSLMESKFTETQYSINILLDNVRDKEVFYKLEDKFNIKLNLVDVEDSSLKNLHISAGSYCTASEAALLKFRIADILCDKKKVLYLDVDILINKDLSDLFMTELSEKPLAAVLDSGQLYSSRFKKFAGRYFNSGVLLMNLEYFRENGLVDKLIEEKRNLKDYSLMDQHVFNIVFSDNFVELPIEYNFLYTNLSRAAEKFTIESLNELYHSDYDNLNDILLEASIVHFASKDKPWKFSNVPFSDEWYEMYRSSPNGGIQLNREISKEWLN